MRRVIRTSTSLATAVCFVIGFTASAQPGSDTNAPAVGGEFLGWSTNGPSVFRDFSLPKPKPMTNAQGIEIRRPVSKAALGMTNYVFDHFVPTSLNNLIWTNLIAHTNGREMKIWETRAHPTGWPDKPPVVTWNTNCLMWGMKGLTALSPCWEVEGSEGQVPVTALTRRHAYTRGHGMGPEGVHTLSAGKRVWFLTTNNLIVQVTVARQMVRFGAANRDYSILIFTSDLPLTIEPIRVAAVSNVLAKYSPPKQAPWPLFQAEQHDNVSAGIPGFICDTWKGGDSGSPNMLPMPGELVFFSGRSTSGPSKEMQADMDELSRIEHLDPKRYQLKWFDLSKYPSY